jgi:hypothetical protein
MPDRRPWASVSSTASTRLAAIRRDASYTVVPSGIVSALDSLSFFTVLSPLTKQIQSSVIPIQIKVNVEKTKHRGAYGRLLVEVSLGEVFPFPLAAAAGSSDLREEADGGRLRVRLTGGAAAAAELMQVIPARVQHSQGGGGRRSGNKSRLNGVSASLLSYPASPR